MEWMCECDVNLCSRWKIIFFLVTFFLRHISRHLYMVSTCSYLSEIVNTRIFKSNAFWLICVSTGFTGDVLLRVVTVLNHSDVICYVPWVTSWQALHHHRYCLLNSISLMFHSSILLRSIFHVLLYLNYMYHWYHKLIV